MKIKLKYLNNSFLYACGAVVLVLLMELWLFRNFFIADNFLTSWGDGILLNLLAEHWYRFFTGVDTFWDVNIFYPMKDTLAYTDMLLGVGIIHSIFRFFGVDMVTSFSWSIIIIHAVGSLSFFYFLKKILRLNYISSFTGVIIFSFGCSYIHSLLHYQVITISFLPVLLISMSYFFINADNRNKRIFWAVISILLLNLLFYTGFYTGFFLVLFLFIFTAVSAVFLFFIKRNIFFDIFKFIRQNPIEIIFYILFACLLIYPCGEAYLSVSLEQKVYRSLEDVFLMLMRPADFINLPNSNIIWGSLFNNDYFRKIAFEHEVSVGFTFTVLALFLLAVVYYYKNYRKGLDESGNFYGIGNVLLFTLTLAVIISCLLTLKIGTFSLWKVILEFFPGATGIRRVSAYIVFLNIFVAVIIAYFLNNILKNKNKVLTVSVIICCCWIFIENSLAGGFPYMFSSDLEKILKSVPAPPDNCESFFIKNKTDKEYKKYLNIKDSLIAWNIGNKYNIKTLNGYSGIEPLHYGMFFINSKSYLTNTRVWIDLNGLSNVCSYDIALNKWQTEDNLAKKPVVFGKLYHMNSDELFFSSRWTSRSQWGTWNLRQYGDIGFYVDEVTGKNLIIDLNMSAMLNKLIPHQYVTIKVNGYDAGRYYFQEGAASKDIIVAVPSRFIKENGLVTIEFYIERKAVSNLFANGKGDSRPLAIALHGLTVTQR